MSNESPHPLKQPLPFANWIGHSDTDHKLYPLMQDTRPRQGWNRYSPNQPGLYYHPVSQMLYRVQIQRGQHLVHRIALKDLLDWIDSLS